MKNAKELREELRAAMPGYRWTVPRKRRYATATGTLSNGKRRVSTVFVYVTEIDGHAEYEVESYSPGLASPLISSATGRTFIRAVYELERQYRRMAMLYTDHADNIRRGLWHTGEREGVSQCADVSP